MFSQPDSTTATNAISILQHRRWSATGGESSAAGGASTFSCPSQSSLSLLTPSSTGRGGKEVQTHLSNLTTLAARLHKKSVLLAQERSSLRQLEEKLAETRALIDVAKHTNREVRRQELQQIMAQHQAELNLFEAQDQFARERTSKEKVENETQAIRLENESLQAQWNHELETVFAPHELLLQGFFERVQKALDASKQKQATLDRIQSATRRLKDSRKETMRDHMAMVDDIARLKHEERQGVSNISNVATQVKQALSQVGTLYA